MSNSTAPNSDETHSKHVSTHDAQEDARNQDILIYVNGEMKHRSEALVSVYDSGFMLGDGVWEGLRLYDGYLTFLDEHLDRLYEAALYIDLDIGLTRAELTKAIWATLRANDMTDNVHLRVMVTRGLKKKPFQHPHLSIFGSTVVIIAEHSVPDPNTADRGIRLHRPASSRVAFDTRCQAEFTFQTELHHRAEPRTASGGRRGIDA